MPDEQQHLNDGEAGELDARYPLIQTLLYDTPLMISQSKADVLHNVLQNYSAGHPPAVEAASFRANSERKPYGITSGGVAVIPVFGTLTHRAGWLDAMSGMTSYRRLQTMLRLAEKDTDVKAVLLESDTPGGAVSGLYALTDDIKRVNAVKPVWAISNEDMFSAGYAIGSAAGRVLAPETAMVGSIGVIMMHMDRSKANEKAGLKYTPIYAGYHKVDGSQHAPLSDQARTTYQHIVDDAYSIFVRHVSAGRGMDEQAVIDTQAQIYTANDALEVGLIDQVATYEETLDLLEAEISPTVSLTLASARSTKETKMSTEATADNESVLTQADLDAAREAGKKEGLKAGREQEQSRVSAILELDSAKGKIDPTLSAALSKGLDAETAGEFLAAVPKQASNGFVAAMSAVQNPDVSADGGADDELTDDQRAAQAVALVQS